MYLFQIRLLSGRLPVAYSDDVHLDEAIGKQPLLMLPEALCEGKLESHHLKAAISSSF